MQHCQVVVGFWQLWVFLRQASERANRILLFSQLGLNHTLKEAQLRVARFGGQSLLHFRQGLRLLARFEQGIDIVNVICMNGHRKQGSGERKSDGQQTQQ